MLDNMKHYSQIWGFSNRPNEMGGGHGRSEKFANISNKFDFLKTLRKQWQRHSCNGGRLLVQIESLSTELCFWTDFPQIPWDWYSPHMTEFASISHIFSTSMEKMEIHQIFFWKSILHQKLIPTSHYELID